MLAQRICEVDLVGFTEAMLRINAFVTESQKLLEEKKKVTLDKVGTFYLDVEKNLQFEADRSTNYSTDSFGFSDFRSAPIKRTGTSSVLSRKSDPEITLSKPVKTISFRKIAAIIAIPVLAGGIWMSIQFSVWNNVHVNWSSLNPFSKVSEENKTQPSSEPETLTKNITIIPTEKEIAKPKIDPEVEKPLTVVEPTPVPVIQTGNIYIIAGCFKINDNATRFLNDLKSKGYPAIIAGQNAAGLTMVSYGVYADESSANQAVNEIRKQNADAWIFVK